MLFNNPSHACIPAPGSPGQGSSASTDVPSSGPKIKRSPSSILKTKTPSPKNQAPEKLNRTRRVPTMTMEEEAAQDKVKEARDERNAAGVSPVRRAGTKPKAKAAQKASKKINNKKAGKRGPPKKVAKAKAKSKAGPKKTTAQVLKDGAKKHRAAKAAAASLAVGDGVANPATPGKAPATRVSSKTPGEAVRSQSPDQASNPQTPKQALRSQTSDEALASKTPEALASKTPEAHASKTAAEAHPSKTVAIQGEANQSMPRTLSENVLQALTRASTADKLPDERLPELASEEEALDAPELDKKDRHRRRNSFYRSLVSP